MTSWKHISAAEAETLMQTEEIMVLDGRDIKSYIQDHLPNAVQLGADILRAMLRGANREMPLLIYCDNGLRRSQDLTQLFADFGFSHCYCLKGGYTSWFQYQDSQWQLTESVA